MKKIFPLCSVHLFGPLYWSGSHGLNNLECALFENACIVFSQIVAVFLRLLLNISLNKLVTVLIIQNIYDTE